MTSLSSFYDTLRYHDWYYEYSDDHRVWSKGRDDYAKIQQIAKESPEHKALFEDYSNYVFREGEKPEKPSEDAS